MAESRARADLSGWIVALVLFIGIIAVVVALVPLLSCPSCLGKGRFGMYPYTMRTSVDLRFLDPDFDRCWTCEGAGKLTLLQRVRPRPPVRLFGPAR